MNKFNSLLSLLIIVVFYISCKDQVEPLGKWEDNIHLSQKSAQFSADGDSIIIKTVGTWWWVNGITLDGINYHYYQREDIDLESDSYSIHEACFMVQRRDKNTLFIKMDENLSGAEKRLTVSLEAGDYFDSVSIIQAK